MPVDNCHKTVSLYSLSSLESNRSLYIRKANCKMLHILIVTSFLLPVCLSDPILVPAYQAAMSFLPDDTKSLVLRDINNGVNSLLNLVRMQGLDNCVEISICSVMCSPFRFGNQGGEILEIVKDFNEHNLQVSSDNYLIVQKLINAASQGVNYHQNGVDCGQCSAGTTCPMSVQDMISMISNLRMLLNFKK